jgi:hypothetical protein
VRNHRARRRKHGSEGQDAMSNPNPQPRPGETEQQSATDEGIRRALHYIGILPRMVDLEASNIIAEAQLLNNVQTARARERGDKG